MERDIIFSLSNLLQKLDPAPPQLLDLTLGFLGPSSAKGYDNLYPDFDDYVRRFSFEDAPFLNKDLASLLTSLSKISEMDKILDVHGLSESIKDVLIEIIDRNNKDWVEHGTQIAILLVKIWFLEAQIFIKSSGTLLTLSVHDLLSTLHEETRFLKRGLTFGKEWFSFHNRCLHSNAVQQLISDEKGSSFLDSTASLKKAEEYQFLKKLMAQVRS